MDALLDEGSKQEMLLLLEVSYWTTRRKLELKTWPTINHEGNIQLNSAQHLPPKKQSIQGEHDEKHKAFKAEKQSWKANPRTPRTIPMNPNDCHSNQQTFKQNQNSKKHIWNNSSKTTPNVSPPSQKNWPHSPALPTKECLVWLWQARVPGTSLPDTSGRKSKLSRHGQGRSLLNDSCFLVYILHIDVFGLNGCCLYIAKKGSNLIFSFRRVPLYATITIGRFLLLFKNNFGRFKIGHWMLGWMWVVIFCGTTIFSTPCFILCKIVLLNTMLPLHSQSTTMLPCFKHFKAM